MPNLITHAIFAQEVLKELPEGKYRKMMETFNNELMIGTNGPDFLFFYNTMPCLKKKDSSISKLGGMLHNHRINAFYDSAIDTYLLYTGSDDEQGAMATYIIGHFLHWVLDSTMHPYIVYRTGFGYPESKYHHHRFEMMMDTINLKEYRNQTIKDFPFYVISERGKYSEEVISKIYINALRHCFQRNVDKEIIIDALKDWEHVQHVLYDPNGFKFTTCQIYETLIRVPWLASCTLVLTKEDKEHDVMNREHREWKHPVTGEISTKSEYELFDEAKNIALEGLPLLFESLDGENITPFMQLLGNRTYSNGMYPNAIRRFYDDIYGEDQ